MSSNEISTVEAEIDAAFAESALTALPFAQSAWTLLSVTEDHHFKIAVTSPLELRQAAIYADGLMNSLTYPLRVCHSCCLKGRHNLRRTLVDRHYELADEWLDRAEDYAHFSTLFPLYHAGQISLEISGSHVIPTDWSKTDLSYEAYDRFVAKRNAESEIGLNPNLVNSELVANMRVSGGVYSVDFTRRLMEQIEKAFADAFRGRHVLPDNWQFTYFSLGQYRAIFVCLQSMAYGWFVARQIAANGGAAAIAYSSSVWTPKKGLLIATIARHTGLSKELVTLVLRYLTFGELSMRSPDIAIQPVVDLSNGQYAISPFVLTHLHAERNLCVLLNQIPEERKLYSQLVDEKEAQARAETSESLAGLGLDFRSGMLESTDLDLAIIDREAKVCLCVEIKWFIEPAEVREILARSAELQKGVTQALIIAKMFADRDQRLLGLLDIDESYDFQTMVGSVNFIGGDRVQHSQVPITKLWHLASQIQLNRSLKATLGWLRRRDYLPKKDVDYKIKEVEIKSGQWTSRWYGITYA